MFSHSDYNKALDKSQELVDEYLDKYKPAYNIVREHISKYALVDDEPMVDHVFVCYANNTVAFCRKLTDSLAETGKISVMKTLLPHKKYQIWYDYSRLVTVYSLGSFMNKPVSSLMPVVRVDGFRVLPEYMIDAINCWLSYRTDNYEDWPDAASHRFYGGGLESSAIVVGPGALQLYRGKLEKHRVSLLMKSSQIRDLRPSIYDLNINVDWRLRKYTLVRDDKVIEGYNSPDYELIPVRTIQGYTVAHPWVVAKFLCIDRYLLEMKNAARPLDNFGQLQKLNAGNIAEALRLARKTPLDESWTFVGVYEREERVRHLEMLKKRFFPYVGQAS